MRQLAIALLALGCAGRLPPAWEEPAPPIAEGPVVPAERLHRAELANGLRVIVLEDRRLPRVALGIALRRGAADVEPERAGLAGFTAELLGRGAGARDAVAFAETVDSLGASFHARAGWDSTSVGVSGLSRDRDTLAGLLADAVLRPRFDAAEVERLRSQQLAALERAREDPETLARWNLASAIFGAHRYGGPREGTPHTVAALDAAAARALHGAFFVPGNAVFYATGDLSRDDAMRLAEDLFGAWPAGPSPPIATAPESFPSARRVVVVDRPDLSQAQILLGHEGPARRDPERLAVQLMNTVVGGGGFSSRLTTRVREAEGLAYFAYSSFGLRRAGGVFVAATATRVPEAGRSVALILEELARAASEPPDADEIRDAKSLSVGRFGLALETSDAIVGDLVELDVQGLPDDSLDTYRSRVKAIAADDVARQARERLHPERVAIVVVGPADALRPQLEAFGPVEVVKP